MRSARYYLYGALYKVRINLVAHFVLLQSSKTKVGFTPPEKKCEFRSTLCTSREVNIYLFVPPTSLGTKILRKYKQITTIVIAMMHKSLTLPNLPLFLHFNMCYMLLM